MSFTNLIKALFGPHAVGWLVGWRYLRTIYDICDIRTIYDIGNIARTFGNWHGKNP